MPGRTVAFVTSTRARHVPLSGSAGANSGIGTGKSDGGGRMVEVVRLMAL